MRQNGRTQAGGMARIIGERKIGAALLAALLLAGHAAPSHATIEDDRTRLAKDFLALLGSYHGKFPLPPNDRPRAMQCMVDAIIADIPVDVVGHLADIVEKKAPNDPDLAFRWLAIEPRDNPERHAQVTARIHQLCPDLESALTEP
jgi:hypothetical protein